MKLFNFKILIRVEEIIDEKTSAGIIIPEKSREKTLRGEVIQIADNVESVKVGDKVVCDEYAGRVVILDDKKYFIVNEADVLMIEEK